MNVFVCMATTLNGLINAGVPHDEWISESSWQSYLGRLQDMDVAIVGSKTYAVMTDEEFLPGLRYIVLTHAAGGTYRDNVAASSEDPAKLIARLRREGCERVGVLGGAQVVSSFFAAGVVDELFLDVAAVLSGPGKNLLPPDAGVYRLELLDSKPLDPQTLQLHYKVLRG